MDQKMSDPLHSCPKILSADPTDEKMPDTLSEQTESRYPGSKIPSFDPMNDKMSDTLIEQYLSRAPSSVLLTFDASVANTFIVKQEWEGLDDYLGKLVASILKKSPDEVVMMHPGLFIIPREERLLDLLSNQKFEEAASYCQKSVVLLQGCQGRFVALDLMRRIDDLNTILNTRSMPSIRRSAEHIETSISDYIHLYFPSAIRRDNDKVEGLLQFAMKLPKLDKQGRHAFRCLACGWICYGSRSISCMRLHIVQSQDCIGCSKVTEDMLDRLKAIDETKDVPTLEIVKYLSKNRNTMSESVSSTTCGHLEPLLSEEVTSATGPKCTTSVKDKRTRDEPNGAANSPCLGTPTKKMKPHLNRMFQVLRSETVALKGQISTSVAPEAQFFFLQKVCNLHEVALDLFFLINGIVDDPASVPGSSSAPVPEDAGGHSE